MEVSPALFESIFHSVEEYIAVIQRSGEFIACNQAWRRLGFENGIDAELRIFTYADRPITFMPITE